MGYFSDIHSVDLSGDDFSDSDAVLNFLQKQYAPRRLDYIRLLKDLAMPHMDLFDKVLWRIMLCALQHIFVLIRM